MKSFSSAMILLNLFLSWVNNFTLDHLDLRFSYLILCLASPVTLQFCHVIFSSIMDFHDCIEDLQNSTEE